MAVPKKKTSKSKSCKNIWQKKASDLSIKSLSLARSLITGKSTSFIYNRSLQDYQ